MCKTFKVYINDNYEPEYLERDRDNILSFYVENKNTHIEMVFRPMKEVTTLKTMRYYRS